jgi:hypothetical protein
MTNHCKNLRRKAAAEYLEEKHGIVRAPSTLAKLAVVGGGPTFRRDGRIPLYRTDDLDDWAESRLSAPMRFTSDVTSPKSSMNGRKQADVGAEQKHPDDAATEARSDMGA